MDVLRWLRPRPVSRSDAELLLDKRPTDDGHAGLTELLAAASAPPRPDELAGEKAAVKMFRREHKAASARELVGAAASGGLARRRSSRRGAVVVALCAVVALVGGTAYAAGTGQLPDPVQRQLHEAFASVGVPPPDQPEASESPSPSGPPSSPAAASPSTAADRARLLALCRSWQETRDNPGRPSLGPDEKRDLAAAAGGQNRIESFCAALTAGPGTPIPPTTLSPDPGKPGKPGNPNPGVPPTVPPGKERGTPPAG